MVIKMLKITMIVLLALVVSACANNAMKNQANEMLIRPIPTQCGKYSVLFGIVQKAPNRFSVDGNVINLQLNPEVQNHVGRKVLIYYRMETFRVSGLPYPDGRESSYERSVQMPARLMQVVDEGFDYELIEKKCNKLKEEK